MVYPLGMLGYYVCGFAMQMGGVGAVGALGGTPGLDGLASFTLFGKTFEFMGTKGYVARGGSFVNTIFVDSEIL